MTLIHTALYPEAKPIIEFFNLKQIQTQDYKIYKNEKIVLIVSGIGKDKTIKYLNDIFLKYTFDKAINIGIAGCKDENIKIGDLFSINCSLENIVKSTLSTVDEPLEDKNTLDTLLVDMEGKYFYEIAIKHINKGDIYILKVVSDYLSKAIPKKSFVNMLISNSINKWRKIV